MRRFSSARKKQRTNPIYSIPFLEEGFSAHCAQSSRENYSPLSTFIAPPSMEILEQRLRDRRTESEEVIQKRIIQ